MPNMRLKPIRTKALKTFLHIAVSSFAIELFKAAMAVQGSEFKVPKLPEP
jgi:hypothetical protein